MTLREFRKARGLTQIEMAKQLGCSQARISEAEAGKPVGREFIQRVFEKTNGAVPVTVWFERSGDEAA